MLEKILIFIVFLGPLVFFHELGHFLFARLFGVRVETFSIGFGPKLFRFRYGDTDYCISAIPLGGYVKMFGDDPLRMDEISVEDKAVSFTHKSRWARFWIVMGGPLANFILAYFLFFGLLVNGEKVPEIRVGMVPETSVLYQAGLRPGDSLREYNGKPVLSPTDLALEGTTPVSSLKIKRAGEFLDINLKMSSDKFFNELIKHPPALRKPYIVNAKGETFFVMVEGSTPSLRGSLDELALLRGEQVLLINKVPAVFSEKNIEAQKFDETIRLAVVLDKRTDLFEQLFAQGFVPKDLMIKSVLQGSAAETAGLKNNDILLAVNGETTHSFMSFVQAIDATNGEQINFTLWSGGELRDVAITPEIKNENGHERKLIGVYSSIEYVPHDFIQTPPQGLIAAIPLAMERTWTMTKKTLEGFRLLFTAQVSLKTIGGPIAIGQVASDSLNTSVTYFFQLMALISINLGIINLLPIPVLDGGHILFIILETINRGPVSRRKMEIAQQVGLTFLLLLMAGALFNDISRFFS